MDWISKVISGLKIPLKILLPATCLFSGAILFLNEDFLIKLNLLNWKTDKGFSLGITFLITTCLIIIYILYYIKDKVSDLWFKLTLKKKTMKKLLKLNPYELGILLYLYCTPSYTEFLNFNGPIVQGLLSRGFIYTGSMQTSYVEFTDNTLPIKVSLQPFVYRTLDHYIPKIKASIDEIENTSNKKKKTIRLHKKVMVIKPVYDAYIEIQTKISDEDTQK